MPTNYQADLAFAHNAGYGDLARAAGDFVLPLLKEKQPEHAHVVDLGCGSGIWLAKLNEAGFSATGIDQSTEMIALAQQAAPQANLICGTISQSTIPTCHGITATGECFNYVAGPEHKSDIALGLAKCYEALQPGGCLVFDIATPGRSPNGFRSTHRYGEDWAVLSDAWEDAETNMLKREINTFRKESTGEHYRRSVEIHWLHLLEPDDVQQKLEDLGFTVEKRDRYASEFAFPPGLTAFVATKPTG
ncbi:MAG: class I SAM-dependent methyltransferase [Phycisphaerae bacterium]